MNGNKERIFKFEYSKLLINQTQKVKQELIFLIIKVYILNIYIYFILNYIYIYINFHLHGV